MKVEMVVSDYLDIEYNSKEFASMCLTNDANSKGFLPMIKHFNIVY